MIKIKLSVQCPIMNCASICTLNEVTYPIAVSLVSEPESVSGTISKKQGKWKSFKNKIKGSLRLKSPSKIHFKSNDIKTLS